MSLDGPDDVTVARRRALVVALERHGADIEGDPVSMATPADLEETVALIEGAGRRGVGVRADVRDAAALRAVLPHTRAQGYGRVIATTSTFGRQGNGGNSDDVASKWALVGLVKGAAIEMGPHNVTVSAIAPTGVRTGLGGPRREAQMAEADAFFRDSCHVLPVGALDPEGMGGAGAFPASPAARYVTGLVIDVAAGANARYTA